MERVFGPVELLNYTYDDLARLPAFTISPLVASKDEGAESDKRKKEPLNRRSRNDIPKEDAKEFFISYGILSIN